MPKFPQWLVAELVLEHRLMDPRHVPGPCHPWLPASLSAPGSQPLPSSSAGPAPSKEAGTKARFPLSDAVEEGAWTASVVDQQDNALSLQFSSPALAFSLFLCLYLSFSLSLFLYTLRKVHVRTLHSCCVAASQKESAHQKPNWP